MIRSTNQTPIISTGTRHLQPAKAAAGPAQSGEEKGQPLVSTRVEYRATSSLTATSQLKNSGVNAYKAVDDSSEPNNPYAATVLRFIDLQLQRDKSAGATNEELQSRLQAGLDGFMQGYNEAFEQLSAMGALDENVKAAIEDTFKRVLEGISAMAQASGLADPVKDSDRLPDIEPVEVRAASTVLEPQVKVDSQVDRVQAKAQGDLHIIQQLKQHSLEGALTPGKPTQVNRGGGAVNAVRDFDFKVRTAEGDEVVVRLQANQTGISRYGNVPNPKLLIEEGQQSSLFSYSVNGDLNQKELQAVSTLLEKVGEIADAFFSGKFERAFGMASSFLLEGDQIQSFALSLQMIKTEQATLGQGLYTPQIVGRGAERNHIMSFTNMLQQASTLADQLQQPRALVADLLAYIANQTRPGDLRASVLEGVARELL